jgi:lipase
VPFAVDWANALPRITCPTLLITADTERGAIVSAESAARLTALVPQTKVVHIPGAGHNIRREQQAAFLSAVRGFLGGLSA